MELRWRFTSLLSVEEVVLELDLCLMCMCMMWAALTSSCFMDLYMALDLAAARLIYTPLTHACQISLCLSLFLPLSFSLKTEQKLPGEVNKLLPSIAVVVEWLYHSLTCPDTDQRVTVCVFYNVPLRVTLHVLVCVSVSDNVCWLQKSL